MSSRLVFLLSVISILTGCTAFQTADDRRAAEKACGVDMLREPTLEQLYCMEEKGKELPNYQSLADKIEKKKKEQGSRFEANVEKCVLLESNKEGDLVTGVIQAPRTHPIPFIKERARRYCEAQNRSKFRITNISVSKQVVEVRKEAKATDSSEDTPSPTEERYVQKASFECS